MNEQTFLLLIVVMKSRFDAGQNVIWLKWNHIVEKSSKFVYFRFDLNLWSSINLHGINMWVNYVLKLVISLLKIENKMLLLQHLKIIFSLIEVL